MRIDKKSHQQELFGRNERPFEETKQATWIEDCSTTIDGDVDRSMEHSIDIPLRLYGLASASLTGDTTFWMLILQLYGWNGKQADLGGRVQASACAHGLHWNCLRGTPGSFNLSYNMRSTSQLCSNRRSFSSEVNATDPGLAWTLPCGSWQAPSLDNIDTQSCCMWKL
jgi:hypothetical protein